MSIDNNLRCISRRLHLGRRPRLALAQSGRHDFFFKAHSSRPSGHTAQHGVLPSDSTENGEGEMEADTHRKLDHVGSSPESASQRRCLLLDSKNAAKRRLHGPKHPKHKMSSKTATPDLFESRRMPKAHVPHATEPSSVPPATMCREYQLSENIPSKKNVSMPLSRSTLHPVFVDVDDGWQNRAYPGADATELIQVTSYDTALRTIRTGNADSLNLESVFSGWLHARPVVHTASITQRHTFPALIPTPHDILLYYLVHRRSAFIATLCGVQFSVGALIRLHGRSRIALLMRPEFHSTESESTCPSQVIVEAFLESGSFQDGALAASLISSPDISQRLQTTSSFIKGTSIDEIFAKRLSECLKMLEIAETPPIRPGKKISPGDYHPSLAKLQEHVGAIRSPHQKLIVLEEYISSRKMQIVEIDTGREGCHNLPHPKLTVDYHQRHKTRRDLYLNIEVVKVVVARLKAASPQLGHPPENPGDIGPADKGNPISPISPSHGPRSPDDGDSTVEVAIDQDKSPPTSRATDDILNDPTSTEVDCSAITPQRTSTNPFTHQSYETIEDEIAAMEGVVDKTSRSMFSTRKLSGRASAEKDSRLCKKLAGRLTIKRNALRAARHLLRSLKVQTLAIPIVSATPDENVAKPFVDFPHIHVPGSPLYLPYNVQHNMFRAILDDFKHLFFTLGKKQFPLMLLYHGWDYAEAVNLITLVKLFQKDSMKTWKMPGTLRHKLLFRRTQLNSLKEIRNSYAHESRDLDTIRVQKLVEDMELLAYSFRHPQLGVKYKLYRESVAKFASKYGRYMSSPSKGRVKLEKVTKKLAQCQNDVRMSKMKAKDLEGERARVVMECIRADRSVAGSYARQLMDIVSEPKPSISKHSVTGEISESVRAPSDKQEKRDALPVHAEKSSSSSPSQSSAPNPLHPISKVNKIVEETASLWIEGASTSQQCNVPNPKGPTPGIRSQRAHPSKSAPEQPEEDYLSPSCWAKTNRKRFKFTSFVTGPASPSPDVAKSEVTTQSATPLDQLLFVNNAEIPSYDNIIQQDLEKPQSIQDTSNTQIQGAKKKQAKRRHRKRTRFEET